MSPVIPFRVRAGMTLTPFLHIQKRKLNMRLTIGSHERRRWLPAVTHACLDAVVLLLSIVLTAYPCGSGLAAPPAVKWHPGHYVLAGNGPISSDLLFEHFRGVQKRYAWSDLEPAKGRYDFSEIRSDLALLEPHGKQLVIQVQYKAFGKGQRRVPGYVQGPQYGGGVYRARSGSFDPVLWNVHVGERMDALFAALGKELDSHPGVEAVVLPETSPSASLDKHPQSGVDPYTVPIYVAALKDRMMALRRAFPNTVVIQYANFPQPACPN